VPIFSHAFDVGQVVVAVEYPGIVNVATLCRNIDVNAVLEAVEAVYEVAPTLKPRSMRPGSVSIILDIPELAFALVALLADSQHSIAVALGLQSIAVVEAEVEFEVEAPAPSATSASAKSAAEEFEQDENTMALGNQ